MTQEEKSLLLQDLCARLPYGVKVCCVNNPKKYEELVGIVEERLIVLSSGRAGFPINGCIPYLRPISSMTEKEKLYIDNRWGADNYGDIITYSSYENGMSTVELADIIGFQDWLNRKMFDCRYLIPMGLAIIAPDGMYNSKT